MSRAPTSQCWEGVARTAHSAGQSLGGTPEDAKLEERRAQISSPEVTEQGRAVPPLVPKGIAAQLERPDQATALGCDLDRVCRPWHRLSSLPGPSPLAPLDLLLESHLLPGFFLD